MRTKESGKLFVLYNEAKLIALTPSTHYIIQVSVVTSRGVGSAAAFVAQTLKGVDNGKLLLRTII